MSGLSSLARTLTEEQGFRLLRSSRTSSRLCTKTNLWIRIGLGLYKSISTGPCCTTRESSTSEPMPWEPQSTVILKLITTTRAILEHLAACSLWTTLSIQWFTLLMMLSRRNVKTTGSLSLVTNLVMQIFRSILICRGIKTLLWILSVISCLR